MIRPDGYLFHIIYNVSTWKLLWPLICVHGYFLCVSSSYALRMDEGCVSLRKMLIKENSTKDMKQFNISRSQRQSQPSANASMWASPARWWGARRSRPYPPSCTGEGSRHRASLGRRRISRRCLQNTHSRRCSRPGPRSTRGLWVGVWLGVVCERCLWMKGCWTHEFDWTQKRYLLGWPDLCLICTNWRWQFIRLKVNIIITPSTYESSTSIVIIIINITVTVIILISKAPEDLLPLSGIGQRLVML